MDERCFRPLLCTVKAELGRGQPGLMRWIWDETLPQSSIDRSTLHSAAHRATKWASGRPKSLRREVLTFVSVEASRDVDLLTSYNYDTLTWKKTTLSLRFKIHNILEFTDPDLQLMWPNITVKVQPVSGIKTKVITEVIKCIDCRWFLHHQQAENQTSFKP